MERRVSTEGNEENEGRRIQGAQQLIQLLTDTVSADGPLQTSPSASIFVSFVFFC
jgi:hypothetical protein